MSDEVREELKQITENLYRFCIKHKIPIFMLYADETEDDTKYEHMCITPHDVKVSLKNDRITKYGASLNENFELRFKSFIKTENEMEDAYDSLLDDD